MANHNRVRVYIACSFDGFIAGPDDDLSWLPGADGEAGTLDTAQDDGAIGFDEFMGEVGALLMGRRTFDVASSFDGPWPYGDRPVFVGTHRPLESAVPTVRAVGGDIAELVATAREAAGDKDVYLDGGQFIRQALGAGLVDELIITMVPVLLGEGHALFAGVAERHTLEFTGSYRYAGGMLQVHARPAGRP